LFYEGLNFVPDEMLYILAEAEWLSYDLVPILLGVIAIFFFMRSYTSRMRKQRDEPDRESALRDPPRQEERSENKRQRQMQHDLESLMMELEQLSRSIGAQIDTRFAKLEAAINDADRRIAVLQRLNRQLGEEADDTSQAEVGSESKDEYEIRHAVIYELADEGFDAVEIARDLGKTPGEVELILNLRKKNKSRNFQKEGGSGKKSSGSRKNTKSQ
jgi:hypothetical protein